MDQEKVIDYLESQIPALAAAAGTLAYYQALSRGESVLVADQGVIYEVFPDGSRQFIKQIDPPTPMTKGKKVKIK